MSNLSITMPTIIGTVIAMPIKAALEKLVLFKYCCSNLNFSETKSETVFKKMSYDFKYGLLQVTDVLGKK